MAAVTWIKMSSFVLLMLQVKAETTEITSSSFTVRAGNDTSLSCKNVLHGQQNCFSTTWMFSGSTGAAVELINHGQIGENAKAKSDRLSVAVNCSLVIKKVTAEDVGRYICRQFRTEGGPQIGGDAIVELSVIHMTEHENNDKVILNCSVQTHEHCIHTVQWLFEGKEKMNVKGSCSDTVTFTRSQLNHKSQFYESLKCEVTHDRTNSVQLFPFKLKSSGEDAKITTTPATSSTTTKPTTTTKKQTNKPKKTTPATKIATTATSTAGAPVTELPTSAFKPSGLLWLIILPVGLTTLLIIVVIIKCKKIKGNETQLSGNTGLNFNPAETESGPGTNQDTAEVDDDFSYASISFTKKMKNKARSRGDDGGDTVTYSTVKAFSSSGGVSAAPSDLYSTINHPKK